MGCISENSVRRHNSPDGTLSSHILYSIRRAIGVDSLRLLRHIFGFCVYNSMLMVHFAFLSFFLHHFSSFHSFLHPPPFLPSFLSPQLCCCCCCVSSFWFKHIKEKELLHSHCQISYKARPSFLLFFFF